LRRSSRARSVLLLTTATASGYEISEYLGPVSAQVVVGTGLLTDVFSAFTDFFGASSRSYETKLDRLNESILQLLEEKARLMGANAVLGMRVDHDEISGAGKSMLMVTAAGTAVRMGRTEATAIMSASPAGCLTSEELTAELQRRSLIAKATAGQPLSFGEETWRFILESSIPEIGVVICRQLESRLRQAPHLQPQVRESLAQYLASLPRDEAVGLLFAELERAGDSLFNELDAVAQEQHLMDFSRAADALQHESREVRHRAIRLLRSEPPYYALVDIPAMERCISELDSAFPSAETYRDKVGLLRGEEDLWRCRCGKGVPLKRTECPDCGADRFGFGPNDARPSVVQADLRAKAAVLGDLLDSTANAKPPDQRST
jgi:uncharacterized protein YbjQ (UPF0145 family)